MPLFRRNPAVPQTPHPPVHIAQDEPESTGDGALQADPAPTKPWLAATAPMVIVSQANTHTPTGSAGIVSLPPAAPDDESGHFYKTPIYTLLNPESGSRVTLVSNIHIGRPDYFRQLQRILLDLDAGGVSIHFERIGKPTEAQLAATSEALRRLHADYWPAVDEGRGAYSPIGIVDKGAIFKTEPDNWHAHDITSLQVLEFIGLAGARAWIESHRATRQLRRSGPDVVRATLRGVFDDGTVPKIRAGLHRSEWGEDGMVKLALYREAVAMSAVDLHLARNPGSDLALFWGVGHMPGFRTAFAERGYKDEDEQWISVIDPATLAS